MTRKPVTGFYTRDNILEELTPVNEPKHCPSKARKPSRDHPWHRNLRHDGLENYYRLSNERYQEMIRDATEIVRELSVDKRFVVQSRQKVTTIHRHVLTQIIDVGVRNRIFMKDIFFSMIAELLRKTLEKHHWKFRNSACRDYYITYYLIPDWNYWLSENKETLSNVR